jgi:hypothetical protein
MTWRARATASALVATTWLACGGGGGGDASPDGAHDVDVHGAPEDAPPGDGLDDGPLDDPGAGDADGAAGEDTAGDADGPLDELGAEDAADTGCTDVDGDGYGPDCPAGPDCDDGNASCNVDCTTDADVDGMPDCAELPATLDDYWNGRARWEPVRTLSLAATGWTYGYQAGAHLEIRGGTWYLFSRKIHWGGGASYCGPFTDPLGTEVRASTDEGATWSEPVEIVVPREGTPWECAATDGDAWYDEAAGKWHYFVQCIARDLVWNGCHVERSGADPLGEFAAAHANPVLRGGDLWDRICDAAGDDCSRIPGRPGRVFDEGTFDVVEQREGWFFVSFHGYDGLRGYRGIAKTPDFVTWIAGDPAQGVPSDAIFDRDDSAPWRDAWTAENIGGGAARIAREGDFYYEIIEAADVNLGCTAGQNWHEGLLRSTSLAGTTWEQFPAGNPIIYSSTLPERDGRSLPCNVQYAGIVRDPATGITWLHYSRESVDPEHCGIRFYRLVRTANLLRNADLWECGTGGWTVFPLGPTNLVVYRHPNSSSDGNCYLATNCGTSPAPCTAGQGVYQDVTAGGFAGRRFAFGGKFAADATPDGRLNVVVHELDAASAIVATHEIPVAATATWQSVRQEFVLDARTAVARFQLYLADSATTFKADEMFLMPVGP